MIRTLKTFLDEHRTEAYPLFQRYLELDKHFLMRSELVDQLVGFCEVESGRALIDSALARAIRLTQEAVVIAPYLYLAIRTSVAQWIFVQLHTGDLSCRQMPVGEYLALKERLVRPQQGPDDWVLELDLSPFERGFPRLSKARYIGRGVEYLNRHLAGRFFSSGGQSLDQLVKFLGTLECRGQPVMLNGYLETIEQVRDALGQAEHVLEAEASDTPFAEVSQKLRALGFELGWGRTVERIRSTMGLLTDFLEAPSPELLAGFLSGLPMISTLAVLSPHGFFGQANVLGKPDTGGQVVYILDQVRALERELRNTLYEAGLDVEPEICIVTRLIPDAGDTTCDVPVEPVIGTEHTSIIRVPFRNPAGEIVPHWISRFDIWPYLERFAVDAEQRLLAELGTRPDLVVGNYSDGNLVATLLSQRLGVTQCNIAHALEKSKYLNSDLYWLDHEPEHHFSCQFTADLISMNTADFIITSTYQEIAGTAETIGQYESYRAFSLPGLYRVVSGIDVFDPKFNIVSPGADPNVFFPYFETERRLPGVGEVVDDLVLGGARPDVRGILEDRDKPVLFAMSRLDRIKNTAGLVEWFGRSQALREKANLLIVGGHIDAELSQDAEEHYQIGRMHELMNEYELDEQVRWVPMQTDKQIVGELYRRVADWRGAFVQPALFEAFGLTVVEAMSCGLPVFATRHGGPLEIIEDGISGFHIDPNHGHQAAERMAQFVSVCREHPDHWVGISTAAIERVNERYTWTLYAERLLKLARIYGFWKYISNIEREETRRYLDMFYGLIYRKQAAEVPVV